MSRGTTSVLATLLALMLVASVLVQVWAFPATVAGVAETFPEVDYLVVPGVVWGVLAIACWQAIGVILLRTVALARAHRLDATAYGWLWAVVGCLMVFLMLVAAAVVGLTAWGYSTPAMLALNAAGMLSAIAGVSLVGFLISRPAARYLSVRERDSAGETS
jgi:hypothetical protein